MRSSILAGLLLVTPSAARAQEVVQHAPVRIDLTPAEAIALTRTTAPALASPMQEIRLSHGAKTAIIVTAIVVGALIVFGVVYAAQPGRPLN